VDGVEIDVECSKPCLMVAVDVEEGAVGSGYELVPTRHQNNYGDKDEDASSHNFPHHDDSIKHKAPQDISWCDISFKVGEKVILKDCYGSVPAGKTCAIMGPSGAGKSSLLNVLAGRSGLLSLRVSTRHCIMGMENDYSFSSRHLGCWKCLRCRQENKSCVVQTKDSVCHAR
jgi:hypothetical protein